MKISKSGKRQKDPIIVSPISTQQTLPLNDWLWLRHEKERRAIQSTELPLLSGSGSSQKCKYLVGRSVEWIWCQCSASVWRPLIMIRNHHDGVGGHIDLILSTSLCLCDTQHAKITQQQLPPKSMNIGHWLSKLMEMVPRTAFQMFRMPRITLANVWLGKPLEGRLQTIYFYIL